MPTENYTPDRLIAGSAIGLVTDQVTIVTGQNLTRGTLLGKITASGKYKKCDSAAVDGSQTPVCILAQDTDATSADKTAPVYLTGEFNANAMTFGGSDTAATHKAALRDANIYLKDPVKA